MSRDSYPPNITRWLRRAQDSHTFWAELSAYPAGRPICLHLRGGGTTCGPFVGTGDASGLIYSPEPDGYASVLAPDRENLRNSLRVDIVGFTPLEST
jgi:hypothetical protein